MAGTKSFLAKPGQVEEKWRIVDATDQVVGRLASNIAMMLMGKHRPTYTPHVLCGDAVVVINAEKIYFSGKKWTNKQYAWFTGYTGLRTESAQRRLERHPDRILRDAVRRHAAQEQAGVQDAAAAKDLCRHGASASGPAAREAGSHYQE